MHSLHNSSQKPSAVQGAFRALADPTRRDILLHLAEQDLTIGEVADRFPQWRQKMTTTTLKKTVFFAASPHTVWSFLTDKDMLGTQRQLV